MDDLTKGLIEHLRKNGSDITVREPPQFLAAKDFHPIPREETMTIKKTMRMTIEQEQLICKIATQLQEADLLQFYYWQQAYECSLCNGEPAAFKDDFKHAPDCPLLLAQQLQKTINDEYE